MEERKKTHKHHKTNYTNEGFFQNHKNQETERLAFCVITFEPIEIQTYSAPQNDRLNLNFVKDI